MSKAQTISAKRGIATAVVIQIVATLIAAVTAIVIFAVAWNVIVANACDF
jgi:hypothetical protein